jgi:hypothetical protein
VQLILYRDELRRDTQDGARANQHDQEPEVELDSRPVIFGAYPLLNDDFRHLYPLSRALPTLEFLYMYMYHNSNDLMKSPLVLQNPVLLCTESGGGEVIDKVRSRIWCCTLPLVAMIRQGPTRLWHSTMQGTKTRISFSLKNAAALISARLSGLAPATQSGIDTANLQPKSGTCGRLWFEDSRPSEERGLRRLVMPGVFAVHCRWSTPLTKKIRGRSCRWRCREPRRDSGSLLVVVVSLHVRHERLGFRTPRQLEKWEKWRGWK